MKKIVITGVNGFIGSSLANEFLSKKYEVIGIDKSVDKFNRVKKNENYRYYDIEEIVNCNNDNLENEIDLFYHLAWGLSSYNNGNGYEGCNIEIENIRLSCKICDLAIKMKSKKFIFVGSNYEKMYYLENDKKKSQLAYSNYYGIAKRTAADMCRKMCNDVGISYNNVYLANTFGIGDYSSKAVNTFIKKLINNEDLNLIKGNHITDWVYIDDTVKGLKCVGLQGLNGEDYYIGHKDQVSFKDNILLLKKLCNSSSALHFGFFSENTFIDYNEIKVNKLYQDTVFENTDSFEKQLLTTIDWIRKQNLIK